MESYDTCDIFIRVKMELIIRDISALQVFLNHVYSHSYRSQRRENICDHKSLRTNG